RELAFGAQGAAKGALDMRAGSEVERAFEMGFFGDDRSGFRVLGFEHGLVWPPELERARPCPLNTAPRRETFTLCPSSANGGQSRTSPERRSACPILAQAGERGAVDGIEVLRVGRLVGAGEAVDEELATPRRGELGHSKPLFHDRPRRSVG